MGRHKSKWFFELQELIKAKAPLMTDKELTNEIICLTGKQTTQAAVRKLRQRIGVSKAGKGRPRKKSSDVCLEESEKVDIISKEMGF